MRPGGTKRREREGADGQGPRGSEGGRERRGMGWRGRNGLQKWACAEKENGHEREIRPKDKI